MTMAQDFSEKQIDRTIPIFHQELLQAWLLFKKNVTRVTPPKQAIDIMNESLFLNPCIRLTDGTTLLNKVWIAVGVTKIKDICYEVIPGFLPAKAVREMVEEMGTGTTLMQTEEFLQSILLAMPNQWKIVLQQYDITGQIKTRQPVFVTKPTASKPEVKDFVELRTRDFSRQLTKDNDITIPAVAYWEPITIDSQQWGICYSKLLTNKQGDTNWKIVHRVLPTALSLNQMTVYRTNRCNHCGTLETIDHVILECSKAKRLWDYVDQYLTALTMKKLTITSKIRLLGLSSEERSLTVHQKHLVNWILTITRRVIAHGERYNHRRHYLLHQPKAI